MDFIIIIIIILINIIIIIIIIIINTFIRNKSYDYKKLVMSLETVSAPTTLAIAKLILLKIWLATRAPMSWVMENFRIRFSKVTASVSSSPREENEKGKNPFQSPYT